MEGRDVDADRELAAHGAVLADAVVRALPAWVGRSVRSMAGHTVVSEADVEAAGRAAATIVGPRLRELLARDVDAQDVNPLSVVREAVRFPTEVLRDAGVAPPPRAAFDETHFPGDDYGLVPMTWRDVDESLHEVGIVWGALKARAHLRRHRGPS